MPEAVNESSQYPVLLPPQLPVPDRYVLSDHSLQWGKCITGRNREQACAESTCCGNALSNSHKKNPSKQFTQTGFFLCLWLINQDILSPDFLCCTAYKRIFPDEYNKNQPTYRRITGLVIRKNPFLRSTTKKIRRQDVLIDEPQA